MIWRELLRRVSPPVRLVARRADTGLSSNRCETCRRPVTPAEVPHLFKRGFTTDGLTFTADRFLCSGCFRRLAPAARLHWVPLTQLFED